MPDLITLSNPQSATAEAYRTMRTNLLFSNVDANLRHVALSSPSNADDKSVALANLAVTLAQAEHKTLIVDADLRRPTQHSLWGKDNASGLTNMLVDDAAFSAPPIQATDIENLSILPTGPLPANPADVLASQKMDTVISKLSEHADYLLFDVPPILVASDAAVFSRKLDGIILVVRAGSTRRDHTARAKEQLERIGVNIIGAVLTNAPKDAASNYG